MLFRLELENFYSVRDLQVIDLRLADNVLKISHRFAPIHLGSKERSPKVVTDLWPKRLGQIHGPTWAYLSVVVRSAQFSPTASCDRSTAAWGLVFSLASDLFAGRLREADTTLCAFHRSN